MPEEANEVEVKPNEAPFLFVKMWRHNGKISDAVPVQSTDEAEALAAKDGIWDEYGERWFVAVPVRREVNVTYSLPSNGSNGAAKIKEVAIEGWTPEREATFLASI
jgi:hypothetical protein